MNWDVFCEKVKQIISGYGDRLSLMYDGEKISYTIQNKPYTYTKGEYDNLSEKVKQYNFQPYSIYDEKSFALIVDLPDGDSRRRFSFMYEDKISALSIEDAENGISYSFSETSKEFLWFIINEYDNRKRLPLRIPYSMFERKSESMPEKDIYSLIKMILRLPLVVYVKSSIPVPRERLSQYANSFLFNLAYNLGLVFKPIVDINDLFPPRNFTNRRRIPDINEIMPPKLMYSQDLTD